MDKTTKDPKPDPNRVALRLDPDTRRRLRVFAANQGRSVQVLVAGWISEHLPGDDDELAEAVRGGASREH
jgi:plasmid stability protein